VLGKKQLTRLKEIEGMKEKTREKKGFERETKTLVGGLGFHFSRITEQRSCG